MTVKYMYIGARKKMELKERFKNRGYPVDTSITNCAIDAP